MATSSTRRSATRKDGAAVDEQEPAKKATTAAAAGNKTNAATVDDADGSTGRRPRPVTKKAQTGKRTSAKKAPARTGRAKAKAGAADGPKRVAKKTGGSRSGSDTKKAATNQGSSRGAANRRATTHDDEKSTVSTNTPVAGSKPATHKRAEVTAAAAQQLAVREDEAPWTAAELDEQTALLKAENDRLRAEIVEAQAELEDLLVDTADSSGDDPADAGGKNFDREHELSLANNTRDMLVQVERALERIANGTYGSCESCGNPIGKARLQAFPRATLCVPCKQREERR